MTNPILDRFEAVDASRRAACKRHGRAADDVQLIAVSKTYPPEDILPLLEQGHRAFGENRVQEAMAKWPALKQQFTNVQLHLIGSLQSNKAEEAVALFDVIHVLDRMSLAEALAKAMRKSSRQLPCYLQVNIGDEAQKGGCAIADVQIRLAHARGLGLDIIGLMCLPPAQKNPAPFFALLQKLAARHGLKKLSMGMSDDFETAIQLGATDIRVGSAIFGPRG